MLKSLDVFVMIFQTTALEQVWWLNAFKFLAYNSVHDAVFIHFSHLFAKWQVFGNEIKNSR